MKQPDLQEPVLQTPSVQPPVQLPLWWGETDPEGGEKPPAGPPPELAPASPAWVGSANAGRDQVIEAETRRAKMVCVGLLGFLLLVLRYVGS